MKTIVSGASKSSRAGVPRAGPASRNLNDSWRCGCTGIGPAMRPCVLPERPLRSRQWKGDTPPREKPRRTAGGVDAAVVRQRLRRRRGSRRCAVFRGETARRGQRSTAAAEAVGERVVHATSTAAHRAGVGHRRVLRRAYPSIQLRHGSEPAAPPPGSRRVRTQRGVSAAGQDDPLQGTGGRAIFPVGRRAFAVPLTVASSAQRPGGGGAAIAQPTSLANAE